MVIASNENTQIRLATDNDFEDIFSIWLDGINTSFDKELIEENTLKEKFSLNYSSRQGIFNFWVAVDNQNNVLGWQSLIKTSNNPFRENTFAESSTYISNENRYKGVGKLLLDFVMKEAEKSPLEYVIGFVSIHNEAAKKITQETGWVEVGQMPPSKSNNSNILKSFLVRPV